MQSIIRLVPILGCGVAPQDAYVGSVSPPGIGEPKVWAGRAHTSLHSQPGSLIEIQNLLACDLEDIEPAIPKTCVSRVGSSGPH